MSLIPFWIIIYFLEATGSLSLQQPCDMTFVPCPRPKINEGSRPWFNHEIFVMVTKMKTNLSPSEKFLLCFPWELSKTSSRRVEEDVHKIGSWSGTKFPMKKACLHKTKSQIWGFFPKSPVRDQHCLLYDLMVYELWILWNFFFYHNFLLLGKWILNSFTYKAHLPISSTR